MFYKHLTNIQTRN